MSAKSSDGKHRGGLSGPVTRRKHSIFNQQLSVICFHMTVSLLCYDNLMRYLVAKGTKASRGAQQGTKTVLKEKKWQAYSHQVD